MHALLLVARFVHIFCGVYWVGSIFFINIFLGPSLQDTGPQGIAVMKALSQRKYFEFAVWMAVLAILAGFYLVWVDSVGFDPAWFGTAFGMAISIGMAASLIALAIGIVVIKPALLRLGAAGMQLAQATDQNRAALTDELAAGRKHLMAASIPAMALLLLTVAVMAVARYL